MTYRVILEEKEIVRDLTTYHFWAVSADRIIEEAAAYDLVGRVSDKLVTLESTKG